MVTMVTLGVLLLLPVGVLMESLLCWYLVTVIIMCTTTHCDHYLAWYFSFMWLVWSRMLWLCRTPAPATALSRSPGAPPWCLQEPPAWHKDN